MVEPANSPPSPKRRLAVFLDGTSDTASGNTNVWRLKSMCATECDPPQLIFYSPGVGTALGEIGRGLVFGYGIDDVITAAYQWLVETYEDGDDIFIFGFSRGAYEARSLSGLLSRCGLIKLGAPISIKQLYARYQRGNQALSIHELLEPQRDRSTFTNEEKWLIRYCFPVCVEFTGVWDTVGAVPTSGTLAFVTGGDHSFLDVNTRKTEKNIYHALAIDEHRKVFDASLLSQYVLDTDLSAPFSSPRPLDSVEQRWFVGSHGNVGGGSYDDVLSQLPLRWLMSKAVKHGLQFRCALDIDADVGAGEIDDSFKSFLNGAYAALHAEFRYYRPIGRPPELRPHSIMHTINETIDGSVFDRWRADESYRPTNLKHWADSHGVKIEELTQSRSATAPSEVVPD